jgi:exopolyphosphatase / guanosine-5'-triphosphate,3'-diphosphate pyrophosphatase
MADRLAAIDIGTNSVRLLVAEEAAGAGPFTTLERLMRITRLGQGVDAAGGLAPAAIDRTVSVLREYRRVIDSYEIGDRLRMTATSAARDAVNRDDFFDEVEQAVGVRPELISGDEEGRLSFQGATAELDPADGPFLVVDIGGGSSEFVLGTTEPVGAVSVDVGCVRLTEKYLEHDPPRPEELHAAISVTQAYLDDVRRDLPGVADANTFVGLAGTITTVAAVELGLAAYDRDRIHHFVLTKDAAEDVFRTLATEGRADRIHNPGLEEARADVIVGGCCALVAVFRTFGFTECLVSEADILDGLIRSQL